MRLSSQPRSGQTDCQSRTRKEKKRQERRPVRARLAAVPKQGSSKLEEQGCAFLRVRMWLQRLKVEYTIWYVWEEHMSDHSVERRSVLGGGLALGAGLVSSA